jgi:hypothetical protein
MVVLTQVATSAATSQQAKVMEPSERLHTTDEMPAPAPATQSIIRPRLATASAEGGWDPHGR